MLYTINEIRIKLLELGYAPDSPFKELMDSALSRDISEIHNTQSHMRHSYGIAQAFLKSYPQFIYPIKKSPYEPFDIKNDSYTLNTFQHFIQNNAGSFGEYSYDICRNFLPQPLGGNTTGGGGGGHELKIALRLIAEII